MLYFSFTEDGYAYLKITDTAGAPCKLESTVYGQSVKAVCIEFHYTSIGDNEHGVDVGFEHGGYQTDLFSVAPRNTAGKWYKIGASCCLQGANSESERYVSLAEKYGRESLAFVLKLIINLIKKCGAF